MAFSQEIANTNLPQWSSGSILEDGDQRSPNINLMLKSGSR